MSKKLKRTVRATALLGAAVVAAGSLGLLASPALAAPGDAGHGSITVYKFEKPVGAELGPNDGSKLPDASIAGALPLIADFTVCEIDNIDLSKQDDWLRLSKLTAVGNPDVAPGVTESTPPANAAKLGACIDTQTTDASTGKAVFHSLPADRAYMVYESKLPAGSAGPVQATILTVPYPGKDDGNGNVQWNYNPHIYPKNSILGKGSTKNGKLVGDTVSFDVTVPIVSLPGDQKHTQFVIKDTLSSSIKFTTGKVVLTPVAPAPEVTLVEGTHYALSNSGGTVTMSLLPEGLKLVDGAVGGKLVFTINADLIATGDTTNKADVTINGKVVTPEVPNPEDFSAGWIAKTGKLKSGTTEALQGAQFEVFNVKTTDSTCPTNFADAQAKAAVPANGITQVKGGPYESGIDGKTKTMALANGQKFCAYETKIPSGFKGETSGYMFTVAAPGEFLKVENTQVGVDKGDLPALPITGAAGQVLLLGSGAALLAAAGVMFALRRRKATQSL